MSPPCSSCSIMTNSRAWPQPCPKSCWDPTSTFAIPSSQSCKAYQTQNHRLMGCFGLEETLKPNLFQLLPWAGKTHTVCICICIYIFVFIFICLCLLPLPVGLAGPRTDLEDPSSPCIDVSLPQKVFAPSLGEGGQGGQPTTPAWGSLRNVSSAHCSPGFSGLNP